MPLKIAHDGPTTGVISYLAGKLWLWIFRWKVEANIPKGGKCLLIAAPHTSNWDLMFMLAATNTLRLSVSWVGKHTIFKKPFDRLMRSWGGVPIDRGKPQGVVEQLADEFRKRDKLVLVIAPSGTRKKVAFWKSGFYRVALRAGVPLSCGFLDYKRRIAGLGLSFMPSGDVAKDMQRIRDFYADMTGKYPEHTSPPRLKEEQPLFLEPFEKKHLPALMSWFTDEKALRQWGGPKMRYPFDEKSFWEDLDLPRWQSWSLLDEKDNLVGFGQVTERFGRHHLGRLVVDPRQRGKGFGLRLVEMLMENARKEAADKEFGLYVYPQNIPAFRCYLALGFRNQPDPSGGALPESVYMVRPA